MKLTDAEIKSLALQAHQHVLCVVEKTKDAQAIEDVAVKELIYMFRAGEANAKEEE